MKSNQTKKNNRNAIEHHQYESANRIRTIETNLIFFIVFIVLVWTLLSASCNDDSDI